MEITRVTPIQAAAGSITLLSEPLVRGCTIVPVEQGPESQPQATIGVDPEVDYTTENVPPLQLGLSLLVVVNDASFEAATADAMELQHLLTGVDVVATVLVSGELLLELTPGARAQRLGEVLGSMPQRALEPVTELEAWLPTRRPQFAPVECADASGDALERWEHTLATGTVPDEETVSLLGALALDEDERDELLTTAARAVFASLDTSSTTREALGALIRTDERPTLKPAVIGGAAAMFAARRLADQRAAGVLAAIGALLLFNAGRSKTAYHASSDALLYDRSSQLVQLIGRLIQVQGAPRWLNG